MQNHTRHDGGHHTTTMNLDEIKALPQNVREHIEVLTDITEKAQNERDEADQQAGKFLRENTYAQGVIARNREWVAEAKESAGYHPSVSFDVVWDHALAALIEARKTTAHAKGG